MTVRAKRERGQVQVEPLLMKAALSPQELVYELGTGTAQHKQQSAGLAWLVQSSCLKLYTANITQSLCIKAAAGLAHKTDSV